MGSNSIEQVAKQIDDSDLKGDGVATVQKPPEEEQKQIETKNDVPEDKVTQTPPEIVKENAENTSMMEGDDVKKPNVETAQGKEQEEGKKKAEDEDEGNKKEEKQRRKI